MASLTAVRVYGLNHTADICGSAAVLGSRKSVTELHSLYPCGVSWVCSGNSTCSGGTRSTRRRGMRCVLSVCDGARMVWRLSPGVGPGFAIAGLAQRRRGGWADASGVVSDGAASVAGCVRVCAWLSCWAGRLPCLALARDVRCVWDAGGQGLRGLMVGLGGGWACLLWKGVCTLVRHSCRGDA